MASEVPRDPSLSPELRRFLDGLVRNVRTLEEAGSVAPADASYVTIGTNATLTAERVLTAGSGIGLTDGGAGSTATIAVLAGAVLQCLQTTYTTNADLTTAIPIDDTVPTSSEGTEVLSLSITPASSSNKILALVDLFGGAGGSTTPAMALFRGSSCIAAKVWTAMTAATVHDGNLIFLDSPATTSATTYSVRVGAGATIRLNGTSASRLFGGVGVCTLTLLEIKG